MRIKIQQFLFGKSYSWAVVGQNIGRSLIKQGHDVEFISTDGFEDKYCPDDLQSHVRAQPSGKYDCQISYTAPHNWPAYLSHGDKNRFAIWNFEYKLKQSMKNNVLLPGFAKNHHAADLLFPSSHFSKQVFLDMGMPEEKTKVLPHGFNVEEFKTEKAFKLSTKKSKKILLNINQPHKRKNIPAALEMFGKAFKKTDDVCLVAKVFTSNHTNSQFDVDFHHFLRSFKRKYPNHAEIEIVTSFIPNIAELYNACDINFSATHAECFWLPGLEALAAEKINVVPNYGGQLDFCNEENSLLIDCDEVRAPKDHLYWEGSSYVVHSKANIKDGANKLREAVFDYDNIKEKLLPGMKGKAEEYTWDNVAKTILNYCK